MICSVAHLATALSTPQTVAVSPNQSISRRRRDEPAGPPIFNTTILSANGTDVTSSFPIMIYYQPNMTNVTGSLPDQASFSRPINFCESQTAKFRGSHCEYTQNSGRTHTRATLQDYITFCVEPPELHPAIVSALGLPSVTNPNYNPRQRNVRGVKGKCSRNEICVDRRNRIGFAFDTAYCVSTEYMVRMIMRGERQDTEKIRELGGKTAWMIVSHSDESTPMRVNGIDIKTGVIGKANSGTQGIQDRKCHHCFELGTQKMEEGTDFLQMEASLMTAAAIITGVVYIIVSG